MNVTLPQPSRTGGRRIAPRRSIFTRLLVWAILVSLAAITLLWSVTAATIDRTARNAASAAVDVDLSGLVDIYASGGRGELERRLADRLAMQPSSGTAPHYLLADAHGRRIAGDVRRWPALSAERSEAGPIEIEGVGPAFARATRLGPDEQLLVARETGDTRALQGQILLVFIAAGSALVLFVALVGRWMTRRLGRRLDRINEAFDHPDPTRLAALAAAEPGSDEIASLARHTGAVLGQQQALIASHRDNAAHIAHEIRTPLMHLDQRLQKVLRGQPSNDVAGPIDAARGDIRRVIAMLESLLDIAASEVRRGDRLGLEQVDFSALVERLADLYAGSAEESGHAFLCEIAPGVTILGEEAQLARLVTNLLDNAFKYVPAGGTVRLGLQAGPVLTVADDGPGIAETDRSRIFERFSRGIDAVGDGAGLGLALCRAIAERHGLTLGLAPRERGACFVAAPPQLSNSLAGA